MSSVTATHPVRGAAPFAALIRVGRIALALAPLVAVHLALLAIPFVEFSYWYLLLVFVLTRTAGMGITIGFHRYFSHHSFRTSRPVQFGLAVLGCTAFQKGPLWWVIHHRLHHQHSDEPGDPHSPVVDGFWYSHLGWLFAKDRNHPDYRLVRDLTKFPELVWLDRLWMAPGLLMALGLYLTLGWGGVVYGFCLTTVLVFQGAFAVNSVGHLFGPQRFDTGDGSRNNWVLGYASFGDGWHNNHHRAPTSARHGFAWYEFDQSYAVIRTLGRLGLVWGIKEPPAALAGPGLPARNAKAARRPEAAVAV